MIRQDQGKQKSLRLYKCFRDTRSSTNNLQIFSLENSAKLSRKNIAYKFCKLERRRIELIASIYN